MDTNFWIFAFLLVAGSSVYFTGLEAANLEEDSDLVFDLDDTLRDTTSHEDNKLVRRDTSPVNQNEHWLTHTLHRIRRHLFSSWFNSDKADTKSEKQSSKIKRNSEDDSLDSINTNDDHNETNTDSNLLGSHSNKHPDQDDVENFEGGTYRGPDKSNIRQDDEDSLANSGEGSGPVGLDSDGTHSITGGVNYRITFTVLEPIQEFENEEKYRLLQDNLAKAIDKLYEDLPGYQTAKVIKAEKREADSFTTKVTVDLGTIDYYNSNKIKETLYHQLQNFQILDPIPASESDFSFREFIVPGIEVPDCPDHYMPCRHGGCVPAEARCNNTVECNDGSDEEGCETVTGIMEVPHIYETTQNSVISIHDNESVTTVTLSPENNFPVPLPNPNDRCRGDDKVRCGNTGSVYICEVQKCDGHSDCPDGEDEIDCEGSGENYPEACAQGEFSCDVRRCIPIRDVCNKVPDCDDGTDESIADCKEAYPCNTNQFTCRDESCISRQNRCDGKYDCDDRSDEVDCSHKGLCEPHQFKCHDGLCIDQMLRCNFSPDCQDNSDEENCNVCSAEEFRCNDRSCIKHSRVCDGKGDCPHSEDEDNCATCDELQFTCRDKSCVDIRLQCDGHADCPGGEDEHDCKEATCREDQFRCNDGSCIPSQYQCDNTPDCSDNSDEENCRPELCPEGKVKCEDGSCAFGAQCDGNFDCADGNDERNCEHICTPEQFRCSDGYCIDEIDRCNGHFDCADNSDEENCVTHCRDDESLCKDGLCLLHTRFCDGVPDCNDHSDELNCNGTLCSHDEFQCGNKICVNNDFRCDGFADCTDGTDEVNCTADAKCKSDEFDCGSDDVRCIHITEKCDGVPQCSNGFDEHDCPRQTCGSHEFTCGDGTCVSSHHACDGKVDCSDGSDERNCGCRDDEYQCRSGECILEVLRCDRRADCRDGSDEENCRQVVTQPPTVTCDRRQFRCRNQLQCISQNDVCNGRYDCRDSSDEAECAFDNGRGCTSGYFRCENGPCIPQELQCDGKVDCPRDTSDELDCPQYSHGPTWPPYNGSVSDLNLKTYPNEQIIKANIIKQGREVVFQCRDEGPSRARVHWVRGDGLPLPPGSRDINGRLEMPNVQISHGGEYICEASGYPMSTPGSRVKVFLTVEAYLPPPTRPPTACALHEATCSNGDCISKTYVCDGKYDCTDGSDETRCNEHGCEPNEFRCNNKRCVLKTWLCDDDNDCGDNSDEENCATNPPGSPCTFNQFQCHSNNQCVPKSFHCDIEKDCVDGSDEHGCSSVVIRVPPPPMIVLDVGALFRITCTTIGVPTPEVVWRLNWGHVPKKCITTSINGVGTLTCEDIQVQDQGAYSCEAINIKGSVFAQPDTILTVRTAGNVCPKGYFNEEAKVASECISCFCFGATNECKSADLFTYQLQPPFDSLKFLGARIDPVSGVVEIRDEPIYRGTQPTLNPVGRNGVHAQLHSPHGELAQRNVVPYFAMPESYRGNQLKSYGGYLKYTLKYDGNGRPTSNAPQVILQGNGYILLYIGEKFEPYETHEVTVRFFAGQWKKRSETAFESLATREEIMMALNDVQHILIKLQYIDGHLDTTISNIEMDSAAIRNTGQGQATFVEECRCPVGYSGLSCENCDSGFTRHKSGPWLGQCFREVQPCEPGTFGDPSRGIPCEPCPCPLTTPSNQFGRTCYLDSDGQPTCNCPAGYVGRRCEQCESGYTGNPLVPGDHCRRGTCDASGALQATEDHTGQCHCKLYATGSSCSYCKANTFYLSTENQFGCIACFCMGITKECSSSNWYRSQITSVFTRSTNDFKLVESLKKHEPIEDGIRLHQNQREIVYSDFSNRRPDVYYWSLPSRYLGDKVTSYGGRLRYTFRYVPAPGGLVSRNTAPAVELISKNHINLLYFSRETPQPNVPQTFEVPILEQYWQRSDGKVADREHLLMALADLDAILIKATYTTNTREAALISVSLDVADERNTGSSDRALAVEECHCPTGYKGLSCEDCAPGYTRTETGLYLGLCEPCFCNGHSNECDPETGECLNCGDYTTGPICDVCIPGYEGDPSAGSPGDCRPSGTVPPPECVCNNKGSINEECHLTHTGHSQCQCKINVEGSNCDRCRKGTFGLSETNPEGCLTCFCSGISSECSESNLYTEEIPAQIIDETHGFTLTDEARRERITEGFQINAYKSEIGYIFRPSSSERWFWSLPSTFTGNKIQSYGGRLEFVQRYTNRPRARYTPDQDVVIIGNGITIYWTNPEELYEDIPNNVTVTLSANDNWKRIDYRSSPRPASREDILMVLANVEAILIRALQSSDTASSFLADIVLETAVPIYTGKRPASLVEMCRCPMGYRGSSCEQCTSGYYRDLTDLHAGPLGSCSRCPCNSNEESCNLGPSRRVVCNCLSGYYGSSCEYNETLTRPPPPQPPSTVRPPDITIYIRPLALEIVKVGGTATLHCSAKSVRESVPIKLTWNKLHGSLPPGRSIDDHNGILVITDLRVSDSGVYVCQATNDLDVVMEQVTLTVGANEQEPPRVRISPDYLDIGVGDPVELRCEASGNPLPALSWTAARGNRLNPDHSFIDGVFRIPYAQKSDEGEYQCLASSNAGTDTARTMIYVREQSRPESQLRVTISPSHYTGQRGDSFTLTCTSSLPHEQRSLNWYRDSGRPISFSSSIRGGVLNVFDAKPEDSGDYICNVTNLSGIIGTETARVSIRGEPSGPPTIRIEPERQTISQGASAEARCEAFGSPTPVIKWTKVGEEFGANVKQQGDVLRISNAKVNDRGVYVCVAENEAGLSQASTILEVDRRESPVIELYPSTNQKVNVGGSALLQCRVTAGIPSPVVRWSRPNGQQISRTVEEMNGGVLRFTHITQEEEGDYICHAENVVGQTTATGSLEVQVPPKLTVIPRSGQFKVREGESVRFECRGSGTPHPTVQWTRHLFTTGYTRDQLPQGITGEQRQVAIHEISRVSKADEGMYICAGRNEAGQTEERLQLVVEESYPGRGDITGEDPGADNSIHPSRPDVRDNEPILNDDMVAPVGARTELRCRVPDYPERIYLNWIRADNSTMPREHQIENGVLIIDHVALSDAGEYHCIGLEPSGSVLFTAKAYLRVIAPPRITLIPPRQVVRPGDDAIVECSATGEQPIQITWSAMDRHLPSSVNVRDGIMQFRSIQLHDAGRYICKARNTAGEADAVAEVLVNELQPEPPIQNREQIAYVGSTVELRCRSYSSHQPYPQIHWTREHYGLPRTSEVDHDMLTLTNVQIDDGGRYNCEIVTVDGLRNNDYINLIVEPPAIISRSDDRDALIITPSERSVRSGDTLDLSCRSNEQGVIVTWSKVDDRLPNNCHVSGSNLRLIKVRPDNRGVYRCEARGHHGMYHEDYVLDVEDVPAPTVQPEIKTAPQGSTIAMECRTDLEPPVSFHWSKQSGSLPRDVNVHNARLQISDIRGADAGTYICTATNGRVTMDIPTILVVTGIVPYFAQAPNSYVILPTLQDAYLHFNFEISFKPETMDGLILYNGEKGNATNGDFISLALVNGVPEFKFDLGSGPGTIRGDQPLHLSKWHTVSVVRSRRGGIMHVDGRGPFKDESKGKFQGLQLLEPLFIGGVPNFRHISPLVNADTGFVGCISRLVIGKVQQDFLHDSSTKIGVTTCETCSENPCHQGVCQEAQTSEGFTCLCPVGYGGQRCDRAGVSCNPHTCGLGRCVDRDNGFECHCPLGKGGKHCEHDISVNEPAFADSSFLAYPTPKPQRRLKLALKFKATDLKDGILLYCAETEQGNGDFTSLAIKDKHVEFRYDVGNGPVVMRSARELMLNQYVAVSASRFIGEGRLIVNGDPPVTGRSPGNSKALSLHTPLYVGGVNKERITVNKGVEVTDGFNGCVSEIEVSGLSLNIINSVMDSANVQDCSEVNVEKDEQINDIMDNRSTYMGNRFGGGTQYNHDNSRPISRKETGCSSNPCRNEGQCYPLSPTTYRCACNHGYTGENCEIAPNLCDQLKPCQNGGTCNGTTKHYQCDCILGYIGTNCEQRADIRNEANFMGKSYLEFDRKMLPHDDSDETEVIALDLSTSYSDGLIFWHGQHPNDEGQGQDYIALAIVGGYLEFSFDLGSGPAIISNQNVRINDGQRHSVILKRTGNEGSIEIDRDYIATGETGGFTTTMNCLGNIYLGGTPNISLMTGGRFTTGFNGCIHGFELQDSLTIDLGSKAVSGINVQPCSSSNGYNEDDGENIVN